MPKRGTVVVVSLLLLSVSLLACGQPEGEAKPGATPTLISAQDAALRIMGAVAQEIGWTAEQLKAMDTMEVTAEDRKGETGTYTGVSINALLDQAQPNADATTIQFKADFGYVVDLPLAEVRACDKCIVTFDEKGKLLSVMPGFGGTAQVDRLVRILLKEPG